MLHVQKQLNLLLLIAFILSIISVINNIPSCQSARPIQDQEPSNYDKVQNDQVYIVGSSPVSIRDAGTYIFSMLPRTPVPPSGPSKTHN